MADDTHAAQRIGILTAGSDSPGMNAAIRAIGKAAGSYGMEVVGFLDGFRGLVEDQTTQPGLSGILSVGGTVLGTSREAAADPRDPAKTEERIERAAATYHRHNLDMLFCVGGRETHQFAHLLSQHGLKVITLPKGIDNDLAETEATIGFDTAMDTAAEAIDRLHSTAHSHHRIILVEVMGRYTGWLTLGAGIAGGADVIIIPEIPYDVKKIAAAINARNQSGRRFSIIAVAEGGISLDTVEFIERSRYSNLVKRAGDERETVEQRLVQMENQLAGSTLTLANRLEKFTGLETRITILGHLLRGGSPTATDRVLATSMGTASVNLMRAGVSGVMVRSKDGDITHVPLEQVLNKHKQVPLNHPWIESARLVGTSFGD